MGNLERIIELAPRAKLLRQQIENRERERRAHEALGADTAALDREIEAKRGELRAVEAEMKPLLAQDQPAPSEKSVSPTPPPSPPAPKVTPPPPVAALTARKVSGSAPDRVLARINAEPGRDFRPDDFIDICGSNKRSGAVLYRLAVEQDLIERVGKGRTVRFHALRNAAASTTPAASATTNGAGRRDAPKPSQPTAEGNVMAFMRQHPGVWYKAREVTQGMRLADDRRGAVAASLSRLAAKGTLRKDGSRYCWPRPSAQDRSDMEEVGSR